ncbi:MAG: terminase large subunit, partial [Solirubrobacteraceae bacterium]
MQAAAELGRFAAFCANHLRLEDGSPFILEPFQRVMLGDYFAGAKETLILVGKKNGKTSLLSALALWHITSVRDAACVIAATARDQAGRMADQAAGFIRRSDGLGARMRVTQRVISSTVDSGRIVVLAADTDTVDGLLPPTLALVDELHRAKSAELHGLLRDSLGPRHGRMIVISTAGDDETTPLGRMRTEAYRLPHVHRDGAYRCARSANAMFAMHEWALDPEDDLNDLELVKQANPASWQTLEALRERHASPSMLPWQWARFAAGVWAQGEDTAISPVEWAAAAAPGAVIPDGETIAVGVDLGWKWDTTAIVPLWHTPEQKWRFGAPSILVPPRDGTSLSVDRVFGAVEAMTDRWDVTRLVLDPSADGEHLAQRVESELGV